MRKQRAKVCALRMSLPVQIIYLLVAPRVFTYNKTSNVLF